MIRRELAEQFIERVSNYTDYNVNIMDEQGIIIASRDPGRVGQYHAAAHEVLTGGKEFLETQTDENQNVLRGINMVIEVDGRREGVVGMTGNPKEIRAAALMTKMSIETMLRYEKEQEKRRKRENKKEHFFYLLTQVPGTSREELLSLADDLKFPEMLRIPILFSTGEGNAAQGYQELRRIWNHSLFRCSHVADPGHILVFLPIPEQHLSSLAEIKAFVTDEINTLAALCQKNKSIPPMRAFTGSLQNSYLHYHESYQHCRWLEQHAPKGEEISFFYDFMADYLKDLLPAKELDSLFRVWEEMLPDKLKWQLIATIPALYRHNYNFPQAAQELYIHKNTLTYRYQQIKESLSLDPVARSSDRNLLMLFCIYLEKKQSS